MIVALLYLRLWHYSWNSRNSCSCKTGWYTNRTFISLAVVWNVLAENGIFSCMFVRERENEGMSTCLQQYRQFSLVFWIFARIIVQISTRNIFPTVRHIRNIRKDIFQCNSLSLSQIKILEKFIWKSFAFLCKLLAKAAHKAGVELTLAYRNRFKSQMIQTKILRKLFSKEKYIKKKSNSKTRNYELHHFQ